MLVTKDERKGTGTALSKNRSDNLLFLAHEFSTFFETVGYTLDVDNDTVVRKTQLRKTEAMVTSAKASLYWEKVLLEVKSVEVFS